MTITNRRAHEFDRALSAHDTHPDATIAALVAVAGALATVPRGPAPAFRDALRTKLMAEAATIAAAPAAAAAAPVAAAATPLQTLAKVLAKPAMQVATGGLAATIAVTGVGAGAARSLPGDSLYGLKRAVAGSERGGATTDRIDEIVRLLERDGLAAVGQVERTLADLETDLGATTADLLAQVRAGSREAYERLARTVDEVSDVLQALRANLPPAARDELDALMATVNGARAQLAALPLPGGTPAGPGPVTPTSPVPTSGPATTRPTVTPSTKPSSNPPTTPTTTPSTPAVNPPTITVPPVTVPPVPTVGPSLPVPVPPLVP